MSGNFEKRFCSLLVAVVCCTMHLLSPVTSCAQQEKMKALIVDGQNNHRNWPQTSQMMKSYLEETGLFDVHIQSTAEKGTDEAFKPDFDAYRVVISNYNGALWSPETQKAFETYMRGGGGFVVIHAANNAFPKWTAYNEIIGLGGWGGPQ